MDVIGAERIEENGESINQSIPREFTDGLQL